MSPDADPDATREWSVYATVTPLTRPVPTRRPHRQLATAATRTHVASLDDQAAVARLRFSYLPHILGTAVRPTDTGQHDE